MKSNKQVSKSHEPENSIFELFMTFSFTFSYLIRRMRSWIGQLLHIFSAKNASSQKVILDISLDGTLLAPRYGLLTLNKVKLKVKSSLSTKNMHT